MAKKTKIITYNLADRDRKHTGVDRSDLDIGSMIERINAPDTQELVKNGDMFGYYGHETRARFGMNPPDVWVNPNTGESIRIEPAIRTIKLSADSSGNVTAQHEFLNTDNGKYAAQLYENNVGGFSTAITRVKGSNGLYRVTSYNGADYVRQPNYNTNRGDGLFDALMLGISDGEMAFDSLESLTPERAAIKAALETAIIHQFDSIQMALQSQSMVAHYQNEALAAQDAMIARREKLEAIRARRQARTDDVFDSLICPTVPFSDVMSQWDSFHNLGTSDRDLRTSQDAQQENYSRERSRDRVSIFHRR